MTVLKDVDHLVHKTIKTSSKDGTIFMDVDRDVLLASMRIKAYIYLITLAFLVCLMGWIAS